MEEECDNRSEMIVDTLALELESFEADSIFFQKEIGDLRKKYLNKYVAIKEGEIIASGNTIEEVNKILESKKVEPSKTVIEFIPEEEGVMVL